MLPLYLLLHSFCGDCHNARISRNRVFPRLAQRGGTTMGGFFGFKLHLLIHHKGQLMAFRLTDGSRDTRQPLEAMTASLRGKVFADQGYCPRRCWRASGNGASI